MPDNSSHALALTALGAAVSVIAFWLYITTLLPGFDLGDTASFQAALDSPAPTPRQAYPLYFAIGKLFLWLGRGAWEPAYALNVASAVCGALACGLLAAGAALMTGCVGSGLVAALLFASSYTFWSQSIIAEVYALEVLGISAAIVALLAWARTPTTFRLVVFFAVYAAGFGNHLSSILVAPAFALFAVATAPRLVMRGRVIVLAVLIAFAASLQYAWNMSALWLAPERPESLTEMARTFWFDVTKSDWRESLVNTVPSSQRDARAAMYWFDLRQQFGVAGVLLAVVGIIGLLLRHWRAALLILAFYAATTCFAFTYNVGDTHVFYLPSHMAVVLAIAAGIAAFIAAARRAAAGTTGATLIVIAGTSYAAWRAYDTYPAVDRSGDDRPRMLFDRFTQEMDPRAAVLVGDLNWQTQNGLDYYVRYVRPQLTVFRTEEQALTLPFLTATNQTIGREILLTDDAKDRIEVRYRGVYDVQQDRRAPTPSLLEQARLLTRGTPYVLALLTPYHEWPYDRTDLEGALRELGGSGMPSGRYAFVAGLSGAPPVVAEGRERPFRTRVRVADLQFDVRMEAWLPFDTMRRAGFGHVIVGHHHAFTIERGVSFAAFDRAGRKTMSLYAGGLFAPKKRWILKPLNPESAPD